ncbi:MAG: hypothetical protein F7B11_01315 [Caldisphaeraceae archaeon]|nr:hypothetical protein [Caldisphaeraceae archaeon]
MKCRAFIISSPTLDLIKIEGKQILSAGGPPLFIGYSLRKLGCHVSFYGPVGSETVKTIRLMRSVGIDVLGEFQHNVGAIFAHEYTEGKRISSFTGAIEQVNVAEVIRAISFVSPDFVILSPIYNEFPIEKIQALKRPLVIDAQGFSRSIKNWINFLPKGYIDMLHISSDDEDLSKLDEIKTKVRCVIYTAGLKETRIYCNGKEDMIRPSGRPIKDVTGAGDIITGLIAYFYFYKGFDINRSYTNAQRLLEEIIEEVSSMKLLEGNYDGQYNR